MDNSHNSSPNRFNLPDKFYGLYLLTSRWLKKFPKPERYTLGERLENSILDALTEIYFLNQLPDAFKETHLLAVSAKNETAKILFRLALDTGALELGQYAQAQAVLQETGKMLGGWINHVRSRR
jgi:hypothetical protein